VSTASGDSRPGDGPAEAAATPDPTDPDAIRADIEATREQLGRTVDELSNRLDVPARAKERVARTRDTAVETYRESPPAVVGAGAALAGLVGLVLWRRRRKRRRAALGGALVEPRSATMRNVDKAEKKARRAARRNR
jgi:LPXTG-motif cell wall-anchored protein